MGVEEVAAMTRGEPLDLLVLSADWPARLRLARERAGLSQEDLALKVGVRAVQVSRWERGVASPYPGHRRNLSVALDPKRRRRLSASA